MITTASVMPAPAVVVRPMIQHTAGPINATIDYISAYFDMPR
ncbi:hypothetical protein Thpro_022732 [Acidihalobacter prosperus]|uniref:Uncharacterized protein n=1 Tax=Acidihalobacter prosperus TaxID=160660 RepID=A0A1A6C1P2_9GAMM|nr:hypothetical protein Thpro_022732 [Acidihalobacter prosperus]